MFSFFSNISIRNRFNLFLGTTFFVLLLIILVFIGSLRKFQNYRNFNQKVDQLIIDYLEMRHHEQNFLLFYNEDQVYFATGNNFSINQHKAILDKIINEIEELKQNDIALSLNLQNNFEIITETIRQHGTIFTDLSTKIYKRGSKKTGIIGEMQKSSVLALEKAKNSELRYYTLALIQDANNYLLSKETTYYQDFIEKFKSLNTFIINGLNPKYALSSLNIKTDSLSLDTSKIINSEVSIHTDFIIEMNNYKRLFTGLEKINNEIGKSYETGLLGNLDTEIQKFDPSINSIKVTLTEKQGLSSSSTFLILLVFIGLLVAAIVYFILRLSESITEQLVSLKEYLQPLSLGILPEKVARIEGHNEISEMTGSVNELILGLRKTTDFAQTIGKGVFDTEFSPLSTNDVLGNSLLEMRQNLNLAQQEEKKRNFEDSLRKWSNEGLAKFNEILRQSTENIEQLSNLVVRELIHYMDANQGGLFILNDTNKSDIHLELVASYAFGHEKKKQKKIYPGEGLVGTVALEKETIYMTEIPSSYITITSGLGGAAPRSLLIVPMRVESEIFGVIELASFNIFQQHEIEFVEKVSESIAASLSIARINARTAQLLEQSQQQAEEKASQEQEMRQNLEELRQAQEESSRREAEMASILNAVDTSSLVIELDTKGFITSVNQAFLRLLSLSLPEIVDKHHRDFVKPTDEKEYNELWKELKAGENVKRNEHIQLRDKDYWLSVVYAPILDDTGRVLKILSIGTDLTESKLLETELIEQAKYMAEQEEEMRQNLDELQSTQQEMSEKQILLQEAGQKSAENERSLQQIVKKLQAKEDELMRKNEQLEVREEELKQNIKKIETTQAQYIEEHEKLLELNKKLQDNEGGLREALKISQEQELLINQRNQQLLTGEEELRQNIEELQSTREQLQEQHGQLININEELAEKEAEIRDRFTALDKNSCIAEYLPDGTLIYANDKFLETFLYTINEIKGKHHRLFVDDTEKRSENYTLFWNSLRKGISPDGEFRRLKKDGNYIYFRGIYKPLRHAEGDVYKILEILTDITQQKQTNADLLSRIETINLTNASSEVNLEGVVLNVNQMFADLLGYSPEELVGKTLESLSTKDYADSEAFERFRIDMRRGKSHHGLFTFISSAGTEIHMQGTFAPIYNAEGQTQKSFFLGYDVSEKFS